MQISLHSFHYLKSESRTRVCVWFIGLKVIIDSTEYLWKDLYFTLVFTGCSGISVLALFSGFWTHDFLASLLVLTPHIRLWTSWRDCGAGRRKTRQCVCWLIRSLLLPAPHQRRARSSLTAPSNDGAGWVGAELEAFQQPGWTNRRRRQASTLAGRMR